jgi:hypothetical protein
MKPLPPSVLALLAAAPEDRPCKIILNTDGKGHWEVEIFARYVLDEGREMSTDDPPAGHARPKRSIRQYLT